LQASGHTDLFGGKMSQLSLEN